MPALTAGFRHLRPVPALVGSRAAENRRARVAAWFEAVRKGLGVATTALARQPKPPDESDLLPPAGRDDCARTIGEPSRQRSSSPKSIALRRACGATIRLERGSAGSPVGSARTQQTIQGAKDSTSSRRATRERNRSWHVSAFADCACATPSTRSRRARRFGRWHRALGD